MSVPPVIYTVPPPQLNVPPPGLVPPIVPPLQMFSFPPPYAPPPYGSMTVLPSMNVPPPTRPWSAVPIDVRSAPPPTRPWSAVPINVRSAPPPTRPWSAVPIDVRSAPPPTRPWSAVPINVRSAPPPTRPWSSVPIDVRSAPPPTRPWSAVPINVRSALPPFYPAPHNYSSTIYIRPKTSKDFQNPLPVSSEKSKSSKSHSARDSRSGRDSIDSYTSKRSYSPSCEKSYESEKRYHEHRHRCSPSRESRRSRSPCYMSQRDREKSYRQRFDEIREYERKRREYETHHSISRIRDQRSHSQAESRDSRRCLRTSSRRSERSPTRDSLQRQTMESSQVSRHSRYETSSKPMSEREKILEEYRKNFCQTSEDLIQKMEQWSKEHDLEQEKTSNIWYRSSPAELYYKQIENVPGVQQTPKLEQICDRFFKELIERGRKARPEVDELPPLKPSKVAMCKHNEDESSSSESKDECLDDDGLQGNTDSIMLALQRKHSHPRRLHTDMWFNNTGESNGGLLCRCSARSRRQGLHHGVYASEETFPKCIPTQSNIDKLYHYRITVSPPTNFLIKSPTLIAHDEHEFLFSGFSMFSHYKLAKLPTLKVLRFNIEHTILYVEEPPPQNFTIKELDLFEEFLFYELLELVDLDLGKATDNTCSQFHFMPRFVRYVPDGGCEVLSMCEVLKYLITERGLLIPPGSLEDVHAMDKYTWRKFVDKIKGMIVTYPGKKPCSVRVDQLGRIPTTSNYDEPGCSTDLKSYYPKIVHFGIRPRQLRYAGKHNEYQKTRRCYVKYRNLVDNMAKPSFKERRKLAAKEKKKDVIVAISSEGFHKTGLMCDVVQHATLIPFLVRHLRFHKSLDGLEMKIGYVFKQRALLQTALTHRSYRANFDTNPDHAKNTLANCGIRQPEHGDRRNHYTKKKGIVTLTNIMYRFDKRIERESNIKHNERLEFLGDAVVGFLTSLHLFYMFPGLTERGLSGYRVAIVQNQNLAVLAKNIELQHYMLYAHDFNLCREVVMKHAMANCFEALIGSLFLDAGVEVADRVFALALCHNKPGELEIWMKERVHPLQKQEPLGDRKYIKDFEFLQKLVIFENSIGVQFKHIRLLACAFTDRSVGFTNLTLGSNQRLKFLGYSVLHLIVTDKLYRHFPDHNEGHLTLLRSSLVNKRTQSMACDDLGISAYAIYNNPTEPISKKQKTNLLEAFIGALFVDKNLEYCQVFCNACLFPRLQEFIKNQDSIDPKSKLQQCCLRLRSTAGKQFYPVYKVIKSLGPSNMRVYTVGVYFRGQKLAEARGQSIHEAEINAAGKALSCAHVNGRRINLVQDTGRNSPAYSLASKQRKRMEDNVPKAYRLDQQQYESSEESSHEVSDKEVVIDIISEDSNPDSDASMPNEKLSNIQVTSLLSDMQRIKAEFIKNNEYEKLKEKCRRSDTNDD